MAQSQDERVRLRFDRVFRPDTDEAKVVQYIDTIAPECVAKADLVQKLICMMYLPFALSELRSSQESLSLADRLVSIRSIYELESVIQQILELSGISDPRFGPGDVGEVGEPHLAMKTTPDSATSEPKTIGVDPSAEDNDTELLQEEMRSTASRMML